MHYFYHLDYLNNQREHDSIEGAETGVHLIEHAKAFAMAIKYQIEGLRTLATSKFKSSVAKYWKHNDFLHAIRIVYTSTADDIPELRGITADAVHNNFDLLREKPEIRSLLRSLPGLATDLLERGREESIHVHKRQAFMQLSCGHKIDLSTSKNWCNSCEMYSMSCGPCHSSPFTANVCFCCRRPHGGAWAVMGNPRMTVHNKERRNGGGILWSSKSQSQIATSS